MTNPDQIIVYSLSYLLFFAALLLSKCRRGNRLFDDLGVVSNPGMLLMLHIAGIVLLGSIPVCLFGRRLPEIVLGKNPSVDLSILVSGFFVITTLLIAPMVAEKKFGLMKRSKLRIDAFAPGFVANYFILRILFLFAYEVWFRGYFLTDCITSWGIAIGIAVNVALYVLLHSVNGKEEMRSCVPLGLLLCLLCTWTGAAWPAIAIHLALAISYEAHLVKKINNRSISLL